MKKQSLFIIILSVLVAFLVAFSIPNKLSNVFDDDIAVGEVVSGSPVLASNLDDYENAMSDFGYTSLSNYDFIYSPVDDSLNYITWTGTHNSEAVIGASEIIEDGNGDLYLRTAGETHSCKSNPGCNGCAFKKGLDINNNYGIIGCQCQLGEIIKGCQHTVTANQN